MAAANNWTTGKLEHWVVSGVSKVIPDSVRQKWRDYWQTVKDAEAEHLGGDDISEKVEMVGWGVEEAQVRNKEEASTCRLPLTLRLRHLHMCARG